MKCPICNKEMIFNSINYYKAGYGDIKYICEDNNCETYAIRKIRDAHILIDEYYNSSSNEPIKLEVGYGK